MPPERSYGLPSSPEASVGPFDLRRSFDERLECGTVEEKWVEFPGFFNLKCEMPKHRERKSDNDNRTETQNDL